MSVKHSLLALLSEGPQYGAWLRNEFENRTGGTWPLNVGQVYTTLTRLERDGLVAPDGERGEDGTIRYALTDAGRLEVDHWWSDPVDRSTAPRDELAIKLSLAVTVPGVDIGRLVQTQRRATVARLQHLTRMKRTADPSDDLAWDLVLDNLIFTAEAEARWLDHVEARLRRSAPHSGAKATDQTPRHSGTATPRAERSGAQR